MLKADYTEEEKKRFQELRYSHSDKRIMRRFDILWLHASGKHAPEIAMLVRQDPYTVRDVIKMFKKGKFDLVMTIGSNHPKSELEKHRTAIEAEFKLRPPASAKEAAVRIEKLTGVKRSPNRVQAFMGKIKMRFLKTVAVPAKADLEAQEEFKKKTLDPEIAKARAGESVLLFMDAAHFVHSAFLGWLWCFARVYLRAPSGRKRWNVLGAYDAISGELTTVSNDGYVNSVTVCELLWRLSERYMGRRVVVVLDNARYQRCRLVQSLAEALGITLCFLPSYSPNLNLIERLWKFVKKKCLYNLYYENFVEFVLGIEDCLSRVSTDYSDELASLMQLNFQTLKMPDFDKVEYISWRRVARIPFCLRKGERYAYA